MGSSAMSLQRPQLPLQQPVHAQDDAISPHGEKESKTVGNSSGGRAASARLLLFPVLYISARRGRGLAVQHTKSSQLC
ncbi:hypothetical protein Y1Q_0014406 [Alligator mississippiensis]|uniref:Uncharacterized protein n=1 Tax=Alligator mississippiensis TaxID=8496 RepID=A0A151PCJ0_ALLMI|nr:hypothetical protein Y1Q_0014406 [Alligator mississippiensis]